MKVSAGDDTVFIRKDGRIVRHRINLRQQNRRDIPDSILRCAMHLRNATERIRILHMLAGAGDEFAALQQFAEVLARFDLSFVGTDLLDAIHERVDATVKGFQGEGGYQVGFLGEAESFKNGKDTGAHELRTVQQGKAFLAHQFDGLPAEFIEYADSLALPTFIVHVTHTDKRQEKIGKRSKVARCSQGAAVVDNRHHIVVEEVEDALYGNDLHAAVPQ